MDASAEAPPRYTPRMPENGAYSSHALPEIEIGLAAFWRKAEDDLA